MKKIVILVSLIGLILQSFSQVYPNNEDGQYEDMLTPEYYNTPNGGAFREEINKFVHFARLTPFQHPLKDANGNIPTYTVPRGFGDGLGPLGTSQHHNAFDMHVGDNDSNVVMYASIEGIVSTYRDAPKYRDYITITNNVEDSLGNIIGKIVVLYGHVDLNLDSLDNRTLNGQFINKGDTISKHLYSGTLGGAHLHFEIRYLRPTDNGAENYYSWENISPTTDVSTGSWSYGYWDPNVGYGFAHPDNHLSYITTNVEQDSLKNMITFFPNPVKNNLTIKLKSKNNNKVEIFNLQGQLVETILIKGDTFEHNFSNYKKGIYLIKIGDENFKILKE